jgi:hypothetical protein
VIAISGIGQIGGKNFPYDESPGGRVTVGTWLDVPHQMGIEASGFILARNQISETLASDPNGSPAIIRPFVRPLPGQPGPPVQDSFAVSEPGHFSGSIGVSNESRLWGAEVNLVRNLVADCDFEAEMLVGFRYIDLDENLNIHQTSQVLSLPGYRFPGLGIDPATGFPARSGVGSILTLSDQFAARNSLFLGQFGARSSIRRGPISVDVMCKVGFGPNWQQVRIDGTSELTNAGETLVASGGLLALARTNIGRSWQTWFAVAPEIGAQVGWDLTSNVKVHLGYNFLYINSVARPGDQVNTVINTQFVPSSGDFRPNDPTALLEPSLQFRRTEYWVHGINAGVMLRY